MSEIPEGALIPIRDLTTREALYGILGSRSTRFEFQVHTHAPQTGADSLLGILDGVQPDGTLTWTAADDVKKSGGINVRDLPNARPFMLRLADVDRIRHRIRPVRKTEGLPDEPLGMYVITAAPDAWTGTGDVVAFELHEKTIRLVEDKVDQTFVAGIDSPVLELVYQLIRSAGETIDIDRSETLHLAAPMYWPAGTTKLQIVNELLEVLNYRPLWMDGIGNFRATPIVLPADRPIRYATLTDDDGTPLTRELIDGEEGIYQPDWNRDRDVYGVPNKVIAVESRRGDDMPLSGIATNEDPSSPFSYQARGGEYDPITGEPLGGFITNVLNDVEVPDYRAPFEALTELIQDSVDFRALSTGSPTWSDRAHDLADDAIASTDAVLAVYPDLASALVAAAAAATLHTHAYATPQVPATIQADASSLEAALATLVVDGETVAPAAIIAFLAARARQSLIAASAVQASVEVRCLPIPLELLDATRFANSDADVDARHTVQRAEISLAPDGLMTLNLQEVISL